MTIDNEIELFSPSEHDGMVLITDLPRAFNSPKDIPDEVYIIEELLEYSKDEFKHRASFILQTPDGRNYVLQGHHRVAIADFKKYEIPAFMIRNNEDLKRAYELVYGSASHPQVHEDHLVFYQNKQNKTIVQMITDNDIPNTFEAAVNWAAQLNESAHIDVHNADHEIETNDPLTTLDYWELIVQNPEYKEILPLQPA